MLLPLAQDFHTFPPIAEDPEGLTDERCGRGQESPQWGHRGGVSSRYVLSIAIKESKMHCLSLAIGYVNLGNAVVVGV